jgi:hypothetical protein
MSTSGSKALSVTFTPTDAANYNSANATVSLNVTGGTSPAYAFTNVKILSGGYIPECISIRRSRTDVRAHRFGGIYRWGPQRHAVVPLLDWLSDGFFNGGDAIA